MQSKTLTALAVALAAVHAHADDAVRLDEVVVSATRTPSAVKTLPASVTVLDAESIAASTAHDLADLLAQQAGVNVRGGSSSSKSVDLRGFGMGASSNTLILLDGVRLNSNDLTAPKLEQIPLDRIERVEILRGVGAVPYGGGATGGVINIVTRAARPGVHGDVTLEAGSHDRKRAGGRLELGNDYGSFAVYADGLRDDHYRRNNAEKTDTKGMAGTLRYDGGQLRLAYDEYSQHLGLPGPRKVDPATGQDQWHDDPRGTNSPLDYGDTDGRRTTLAWEQQVGRATLYLDAYNRHKDTYSYFNDGSAADYRTDRRALKEDGVTPRVKLPFAWGGLEQSLVVGADWLNGTGDVDAYSQWSSFGGGSSKTRRDSRQYQDAWFVEQSGQLAADTRYTLGYRKQRAHDKVDSNEFGAKPVDSRYALDAWIVGLRQQLGSVAVYGKLAQSFRLPNADELVVSGGKELKPQTSHDKELGLEWNDKGRFARAALFQMDVDNEIQYAPCESIDFGFCTGFNRNLDPTRHRGVELEGRWPLTPTLALAGNYTWQQVRFTSGRNAHGDLTGRDVPLVPQHQARLGLEWNARENTLLALSAQYVGKQRMDNDQNNTLDQQLDAYTLVDVKAQQRFGAVTLDVGVNNLFDKQYASYGVRSNESTRYNLYPEDRRTAYARLRYSF